jgi:hypothetical protein
MPYLYQADTIQVICRQKELVSEVSMRLPNQRGNDASIQTSAALWVEPDAGSWESDLNCLESVLSQGSLLIIIASQPTARLLPERRNWSGSPLGFLPGGLNSLRRGLKRTGFTLFDRYGVHTAAAIGFNLLGRWAGLVGRADLEDRLHFAARQRYLTSGPTARLASLALLFARREQVR